MAVCSGNREAVINLYALPRGPKTDAWAAQEEPNMTAERWSLATSRRRSAAQPWIVGCNFIPSSAANQLEMWQAETFDPEGIARELGWAASLGFNTVHLHRVHGPGRGKPVRNSPAGTQEARCGSAQLGSGGRPHADHLPRGNLEGTDDGPADRVVS